MSCVDHKIRGKILSRLYVKSVRSKTLPKDLHSTSMSHLEAYIQQTL